MRCNNCGFDSEQDFQFCPTCGAPHDAPAVQNPAAQAILRVLKDKLFLALCILVSASCLLSLAMDSIPLLSILAAVFLWLTYAKSRKDLADAEHLRCISGTVYAQYVLTNVMGVIFIVVGVILCFAFDAIVGNPAFMDAITAEIGTDILSVAELTGSILGIVLCVTFIVLGVLVLVLNIFSMRYIHRFIKSVYQSLQQGVADFRNCKATQAWLFIFGGFSGFSALTSLIGGDLPLILSNGLSCALYIVAGMLVRRYFSCTEEIQ